jgi:hypothetical protein
VHHERVTFLRVVLRQFHYAQPKQKHIKSKITGKNDKPKTCARHRVRNGKAFVRLSRVNQSTLGTTVPLRFELAKSQGPRALYKAKNVMIQSSIDRSIVISARSVANFARRRLRPACSAENTTLHIRGCPGLILDVHCCIKIRATPFAFCREHLALYIFRVSKSLPVYMTYPTVFTFHRMFTEIF